MDDFPVSAIHRPVDQAVFIHHDTLPGWTCQHEQFILLPVNRRCIFARGFDCKYILFQAVLQQGSDGFPVLRCASRRDQLSVLPGFNRSQTGCRSCCIFKRMGCCHGFTLL